MGGVATFGLGIVLTLTDNVTSRMTGVNNSLQQVSQTAMSLNYMGKSLMNTGKAMLSPIVGLSKEVIRVGDDVDKARITFGALYNDATLGAEKFNEVIEYAARTPFDVESLKDAALQFKTLGVEIFGADSMITDATGETRQLIDIIGDAGAGLSGVARNGFKDVVYATREFITEGNKLSFLRRLGIDIDAVLAKGIKADNVMKELSLSAGETVEERKVAYANLVKALNMDGLMKSMEGTWSQVMSNMDDIWYLFMMKIGDKGSFKVFKDSFKGISDVMKDLLDTDIADKFCDSISVALESIVRPLDRAINKGMQFVKTFIELGANNPMLVKLALVLPVIAGGLFMLSGAGLVAKSSLMLFKYGLMQVAGTIPMFATWGLIFAGLKYAWSRDIGGMKTNLTSFADTIKGAFGIANEAMSKDTPEMIQTYKDLLNTFNTTGDLKSGLAAKIIGFKTLWGGLIEFMTSPENKVSVETLDIIDQMGLMSTFEKMSIWAYRAKEFGKGVAEGLAEAVNAVTNFARKITEAMAKLPLGKGKGLYDMFSGQFNVSGGDKFKGIGKMVSQALLWTIALKKVWGVFNLFSGHNNRRGGGITDILGRIFGVGGNNGGNDAGHISLIARLQRLGSALAQANPRQIVRGLVNLGIIMTGISLIALVCGKLVSISPKSFILGGLALSAMSLIAAPVSNPTFDTAIDNISRLSRFKWTTFLKGMRNLGIIIGSMTVLAMILGGIVGIKPEAFIAGSVAMVAMGACFSFLGNPLFHSALKELQAMAKINWKTILKGIRNLAMIIGGLALIVTALGLLTLLLNSAGVSYGQIATFALIIAEVGVIGMALTYLLDKLKGIKFKDIIQPLAAISAVLVALGGVIWVISKMSSGIQAGQMAKIGLVILEFGIIGAAVAFLSNIIGGITKGKIGELVAGIASIAGVLIVMAGVTWVINKLTGSISASQMAKVGIILLEFAAVGTAIAALSAIIGGVIFGSGGIGAGVVIGGILTIGAVLLAMSGIMWVVNKITSGMDLGRLSAVMGIILMVGAIGTALSIFSAISGALLAPAILGLVTIAIVIDGIAALAQHFARLEAVQDKIQTGLNIMATIGNGIGKAIGSFIGGIGEGISNSLPAIGDNISNFINKIANIQAPGEGQMGIGSFLSSLADGLLKLTANDILSFFTGGTDLGKLGDELSNFAHSAQSAFNCFSEFPEAGIEKAPKIMESLKGLNQYSFKSGGLAQMVTGEVSIAGIGEQLDSFAHNAQSAFNCFSEFPDLGIEKAPKIFEAIKGVGDFDFKSGGLAQLITGGTDIAGIGKQLDSFAHKAQSAFNCFSEFPESGIEKAPRIFNAIKGIGNFDFKSGGLAQLITGGVDLSGIGGKLNSFAHSAQSAFNCFSEFPNDGINKLPRIFKGLAEVGKIGGLSFGDLPTVATNIDTFAHTIQSAFNCFSEFSEAGFSNVSTLTTVLGEIAGVLTGTFIPSIDGVSATLTGLQDNLTVVSQSFILMGTEANMSGMMVAQSFIMISMGVATVSSSILTTASMVIVAMGMIANGVSMYSLMIIQNFLLMGQGVQMSAILVQNGMLMMYSAVLAGSTLIIAAVANMCAMVRSQLSSLASSGYSYGASLASSIAAGISANSGAIAAAVQGAISSAVASAKINIPSVSVGHNASGTSNWVGGLTEINERGGELIDLPRGTRIYPHDKSVTMAFDEGVQAAFDTIARNSNHSGDSYDDSVHFSAGSIVVYAQNSSNEEAERLAELIMQKIERKQRRRALASYAY